MAEPEGREAAGADPADAADAGHQEGVEVSGEVSVELHGGERLRGRVVRETPDRLWLEVEGRPLELERSAIVALRRGPEPEPPPGLRRGAACWVEADPLAGERSAALAAALDPDPDPASASASDPAQLPAYALFLPSRTPRAWPELRGLAAIRPLWAGDPPEVIPHLAPAELAPLAELDPRDAVYLRSAAPPAALATFLGQLGRCYDPGGRRSALRFYDPRVLGDLWELLEPAATGLLFGVAWTRPPRGPDELLCPVCDATLPALQLACPACALDLCGPPEAPRLIAAWGRELTGQLEWARPWPERTRAEAEPPRRPRQRGLKAFFLSAEALAGLAAAYARRKDPPER